MNFFYKIVNIIEVAFVYIQGKGFESYSKSYEVSTSLKLLSDTPLLCLDIGGNIGNYSVELLKRFPSTEIHIFEPSLKNIEILKRLFSKKTKIKIVPSAISNFTGKATLFHDKKGSSLASLAPRNLDHFDIKFNHFEKVDVICIYDYWIRELKKRTIDIAKIDIEGFEYNALIGFKTALKNTKLVQFEFGGCNIDTRTYFRDLWYFLTYNNFSIYRITPFGCQLINNYKESDEAFRTANFIAINKKFSKQ